MKERKGVSLIPSMFYDMYDEFQRRGVTRDSDVLITIYGLDWDTGSFSFSLSEIVSDEEELEVEYENIT